jgi:hypothetical protein
MVLTGLLPASAQQPAVRKQQRHTHPPLPSALARKLAGVPGVHLRLPLASCPDPLDGRLMCVGHTPEWGGLHNPVVCVLQSVSHACSCLHLCAVACTCPTLSSSTQACLQAALSGTLRCRDGQAVGRFVCWWGFGACGAGVVGGYDRGMRGDGELTLTRGSVKMLCPLVRWAVLR